MRVASILKTTAVLIAAAAPNAAVRVSDSGSGSGGAGAGPSSGSSSASSPSSAHVSDTKLLGQRIMVGFTGTRASSSLLGQIRAGQVGSVILFSGNIVSRSQVRALTSSLQKAAKQGHNPPLLIAVDQEGGQVKRFANAPPTLSPSQMVATGKTSVARSQGRSTGNYLKGVGVTMDLAPVVDVPTFRGAFIWQQGRAFSFSASTVASYAGAFAAGVQSAGVAATAKHFPGLGTAPVTTDNKLQELHPTAAQRAAALVPYEKLIAKKLDAILVSLAGFTAYDSSGAPAALSSKIVGGLLRKRLGFRGVTLTDGLGAPTGHDEITAGVLAARAGTDILLYSDGAPGELSALRSALSSGRLSRSSAVASYNRIVALKRRVG